MLSHLSRHWYTLAIRGVIAILIAIAMFAWPGLTVRLVVMIFGGYALIDGIFALIAAIRLRNGDERWWPLIIEGVLGLVIGGIAFFHPMATAHGLVLFVAFWATISGVLEILAAFQLRNVIETEWMLGLTGVLSIFLGIAISVAPSAALVFYVYLMAAYILVTGALLVALSLRLKSIEDHSGQNVVSPGQ